MKTLKKKDIPNVVFLSFFRKLLEDMFKENENRSFSIGDKQGAISCYTEHQGREMEATKKNMMGYLLYVDI